MGFYSTPNGRGIRQYFALLVPVQYPIQRIPGELLAHSYRIPAPFRTHIILCHSLQIGINYPGYVFLNNLKVNLNK